jgi:hypothetical protein
MTPSVLEVKKSIINEEIVLATMKDTSKDKTREAKDKDSTAFLAKDRSSLNCHYCGIKGHIQPDCLRKRGMNNKDWLQPTKKAKGAKAKANKTTKENKAKASIILTTDTLTKGGTLLQAQIDPGTIRMTKRNGILQTTKANGPTTTRAKTQKGRAKAEGEVGLTETSPAITMALTPIFIKTLLALTRPMIHLLSLGGRILRPITGWTRTTSGSWSYTMKTISRQIQHLCLVNFTIFLNDRMS